MTEPIGFDIPLELPYDRAIEAVAAALKAEGFGILTRIDVRATLREKLDREFRPYVILGACNPQLAHRALERDARVGMLLPCNVTVEDAVGGGALVRIVNPVVMLDAGELAGDPILGEVAREARARLERVASALKGS